MSLNRNEWEFTEGKPYVFISYKREDQEKVEKTIKELYQKYGLNIWYDAGLTAGVNWDMEAKHHIRNKNCMAVLFFASDIALASDNIKKELDTAKTYKRKIIPIAFVNMSFNDLLLKMNESGNFDDVQLDIAEETIDEHLDSRLTYIVYNSQDYLSKIIDAIKMNTYYPKEELVEKQSDSTVAAAPKKVLKADDVIAKLKAEIWWDEDIENEEFDDFWIKEDLQPVFASLRRAIGYDKCDINCFDMYKTWNELGDEVFMDEFAVLLYDIMCENERTKNFFVQKNCYADANLPGRHEQICMIMEKTTGRSYGRYMANPLECTAAIKNYIIYLDRYDAL